MGPKVAGLLASYIWVRASSRSPILDKMSFFSFSFFFGWVFISCDGAAAAPGGGASDGVDTVGAEGTVDKGGGRNVGSLKIKTWGWINWGFNFNWGLIFQSFLAYFWLKFHLSIFNVLKIGCFLQKYGKFQAPTLLSNSSFIILFRSKPVKQSRNHLSFRLVAQKSYRCSDHRSLVSQQMTLLGLHRPAAAEWSHKATQPRELRLRRSKAADIVVGSVSADFHCWNKVGD